MHTLAKISLVALMAGLTSTARAELTWEKTEIELHPAIGDETAVAHFKYQNKGDKQIAIKSVTTSCGCTAASAKQTADPGEKGEVTATFKIGDRVGLQTKAVNVVTDDPKVPTTQLMLKVAIPVVLDIQPNFVYWQSGEEAKAKTIVIKPGPDVSVKNLEVTSSSPDFVTKVESNADKKEFRINVEPKQTAQAAAATLTIKPALNKGEKIFSASARVMPAPGAANPPQPNVTSAAAAPANLSVAPKGKIDACSLLTSNDIQSVQGEPLKQGTASGTAGPGLSVSQCYFSLPTSSNSISLMVVQKGDGADAQDPKQQWKKMFDAALQGEKERAKESDSGREKSSPPEKIAGVGDEAYWSANRVGGELFVLKGDAYIRISVGGADDKAGKLKKSKALAEDVLKHLTSHS
jgi:Protein of unknown function (DUF1573)